MERLGVVSIGMESQASMGLVENGKEAKVRQARHGIARQDQGWRRWSRQE